MKNFKILNFALLRNGAILNTVKKKKKEKEIKLFSDVIPVLMALNTHIHTLVGSKSKTYPVTEEHQVLSLHLQVL